MKTRRPSNPDRTGTIKLVVNEEDRPPGSDSQADETPAELTVEKIHRQQKPHSSGFYAGHPRGEGVEDRSRRFCWGEGDLEFHPPEPGGSNDTDQ